MEDELTRWYPNQQPTPTPPSWMIAKIAGPMPNMAAANAATSDPTIAPMMPPMSIATTVDIWLPTPEFPQSIIDVMGIFHSVSLDQLPNSA